MEKYIDIFLNGYGGYASYLWNDITNPTWKSYFWWLIIVSFFFLVLEVIIPWRKKQVVLRKDFWLDGFYMFFNFFIFSLIIYNAASDVIVNLFNDSIIAISGFNLQASNPMNGWPLWLILVIGFFVRDFVQWWVHRLLHRSDRLWEFHKVHHSVAEMGFAAHLRYHWMENIIYRTLEYLPLALLGIGLHDFFIIHIFTLAWGHFNHSNITVSGRITGGILGALIGIVIAGGLFDVNLVLEPSIILQSTIILGLAAVSSVALGPFMRKVFNSPEMHIWHHTQDLPSERYYGVNFGLTLACWDYIFGTAYVPQEGRNNKLGFTGIDEFPKTFTGHNLNGFK
ncbi:MAG: sterol desaturase family protein [Saprospiraceae bacterium]|jgi:sterol desaturase/sphingolipid hydroxylase (fatty acid hydroxylase superfamily)|nr:sterol desaturase family protein [Saprospiraceae bacterium]